MSIVRSYRFLIFLGVLFLATFLRFVAMGDRPFHHDEGVNFFFVEGVLRSGYYPYTHLNYHGPTYFYWLTFIHYIFGTNEFTHRLASNIPGILTCMLPFLLVRTLCFETRVITALLLSVSSSGVYLSRYSIHESLLVLLGMALMLASIEWMTFRRGVMLCAMGALLGAIISTKETFVITLFSVGVALFFLFGVHSVFAMLHRHQRYFLQGFFLLLSVVVFSFSGAGQNSEGVKELFFGVQQWIGRGHGDVGHHKSFSYYIRLVIWITESVALLGVAPVLVLIWRSLAKGIRLSDLKKLVPNLYFNGVSGILRNAEEKCIVGMCFFGIVTILVYSYVPYKTPWLIINLTLPLVFALGGSFKMLIPITKVRIPIVLLVLSCSLFQSLKYNYSSMPTAVMQKIVAPIGSFSDSNPFAYVHTHEGMRDFANDVTAYIRASKTPGTRILIGLKSYWPLPFYIREFDTQLNYLGGSKVGDKPNSHQIMILDRPAKVDPSEWRIVKYDLSDNQKGTGYFKIVK